MMFVFRWTPNMSERLIAMKTSEVDFVLRHFIPVV